MAWIRIEGKHTVYDKRDTVYGNGVNSEEHAACDLILIQLLPEIILLGRMRISTDAACILHRNL